MNLGNLRRCLSLAEDLQTALNEISSDIPAPHYCDEDVQRVATKLAGLLAKEERRRVQEMRFDAGGRRPKTEVEAGV